MPDAAKIYDMFRNGEAIGGTYLYDSYRKGRTSVESPNAGPIFYRPGKYYPSADAAWRAGRDSARAGEPDPFTDIETRWPRSVT